MFVLASILARPRGAGIPGLGQCFGHSDAGDGMGQAAAPAQAATAADVQARIADALAAERLRCDASASRNHFAFFALGAVVGWLVLGRR